MSEDDVPAPNLHQLPLSAGQLMQTIRNLAQDKDNVSFSLHAFSRSEERSEIVELTVEDAIQVLRLGEIEGKPVKGKNDGEWKALVTFRPKGGRETGVVTILVKSKDKIFVKTVMWRDA